MATQAVVFQAVVFQALYERRQRFRKGLPWSNSIGRGTE